MAYTGPHIPHGFQEVGYVAVETTFDTDTKPAAADALNVIAMDITPEHAVSRSEEKTGNRLPPGHIPGMKSGKASLTFYCKPGAAGVEPDAGPIFEAALNSKTIVGATSVTYAHQDVSTVKSLRLFRGAGNFMEAAYGAIVESLGFEINAGMPAKITAALAFARGARASSALLTAAATMGAGTAAVDTGEGKRFTKGSTIKFLKAAGTSEDNGGLGYLVTSDELDALAFDPVAVSTAAIGDEVMGFVPTPTTSGTIAAAVNQDITIGGSSVNFLSGKLDYKTGFKHRVEGQSDRPSGAISSNSEVSGEFQCYFRDDQVGDLAFLKWDGTYKAVTIRAGEDTAAARMKLVLANVLVEVSAVKMPTDGSAGTFTIKFQGKTAFNVLFD